MQCGKAPGADLFMTEYLKFAGDTLRTEVFAVASALWRSASSAAPGKEADDWPAKWKEGIIFPLWKCKGHRHDKNTWRGITLLSVGSKLVARICSARLQRWSAPWLNPFQFGFRKGSGVDDVQQVTRSILEEAAGSIHDKTVWLRFYDLEKAYPKVSRPALWKLLALKGCPAPFLGVLHALHDHTASSVRFEGAFSSAFIPERGLREGCPSSPVLFNIYHSGIMEVFRARRLRATQVNNWALGLAWTYKVDGKLGKRRLDRLADTERNVKHMIIGDIAYADDTAILGEADGTRIAEGIFASTITDFAGKNNMAKTEGLRLTANPASSTDVPFLGEQAVVKHVGALLHNRGSHANETNARLNKTTQKLGWVSSAWLQGRGSHRNKRRVSFSVRIKVMKTVVKGVLGSFSKTRAWQTHHLDRAQKVINTAIRRCLNVRLGMMHQHGLSNRILSTFCLSHDSVQQVCVSVPHCVRPRIAMANPPRQANKGVLKQEVKGLGDRLDRVEERLDRVELAARNPTVIYGWNTARVSTRCLKNCQPINWNAKTYELKPLPSLTGKYDKRWQVISMRQQHRKKANNCPTARRQGRRDTFRCSLTLLSETRRKSAGKRPAGRQKRRCWGTRFGAAYCLTLLSETRRKSP